MQYGTSNTEVQSSQRKRSVKLADRVWFQNGANPIIAMLKGKGYTDTAENQKVEWMSDARVVPTIKVAAAGASDTSITLVGVSNAILRVGDILVNPATKEQMRVTGRVSTDKVSVQRGYGTTAAAAVAAGELVFMAGAFAEGTRSPEGSVILRNEDYNYSQIFKDAIEITRNELKSPRYAEDGDKRKERRNKIVELHKRKIETQLLFGERKKDTDDLGNALYIAGGMLSFIKTNRVSITGGFTIAKFNEALAAIANMEASGDKMLFCGSNMLNAINNEGISRMAGGQGPVIKSYGVDVVELMTSYGKVGVAFHPVISQVYPNMGLLLDLENIRYTTIDDTEMMLDVQDKDYDGIKDLVLTDATMQVWNEERHAVITLD